jgi:hypothetical protein
MLRRLAMFGTIFASPIFSGGCFPTGSSSSDGGSGAVGYSAPTLEVTVNGVHFGPAAPDPGAFADLVVTRDASGNAMGGSFRLGASVGSAGCALAFDRYGSGVGLGVGMYLVQSMQGAVTADGTVYPTSGERIATPGGGAGCTGSGCDGAAFVLSAVDATHATGYFQGTVVADSGAGEANVVCSFWVPMRSYQP